MGWSACPLYPSSSGQLNSIDNKVDFVIKMEKRRTSKTDKLRESKLLKKARNADIHIHRAWIRFEKLIFFNMAGSPWTKTAKYELASTRFVVSPT